MIVSTLIFITAIAAFSLSSISGGGASLILIPLLAISLPISEVPFSLVIGTFTSSLTRSIFYCKKINWKLVSKFVPAALPSVALGSWLLTYIDPIIIRWICGIFLISNIKIFINKNNQKKLKIGRVSSAKVLGIGFLAGLVSGMTGAVGLLFNGFYLKSGLSKDELIATRAANEILLHLIKLYFYISLGLYSAQALKYGLLLALGAILSTIVIKKLLPYLNESTFKRVGIIAMVGSGIFLLAETSNTIALERKPSVKIVGDEDGIETEVNWAKKTSILEIEYNDFPTFERVVEIVDLPIAITSKIGNLSANSTDLKIEEVFGFFSHYYEVYVYQGDRYKKYEISYK